MGLKPSDAHKGEVPPDLREDPSYGHADDHKNPSIPGMHELLDKIHEVLGKIHARLASIEAALFDATGEQEDGAAQTLDSTK